MPPDATAPASRYDCRARFNRFKAPAHDARPKKAPAPEKDADSKSQADAKAREPATVVYDPWVRCLEGPAGHADWEDREWYAGGGLPCPCALRQRWVARWAEKRAQEIEAAYGGRWCGVVRVVDQYPTKVRLTRAQIDAVCDHILNGPDSVARQWLLRRKGGSPCAPSVTT